MKNSGVVATAAAFVALAHSALAGPVPYPNPGTPNPVVYTFTASSTGDIVAYFAGSGADYDEQVGLLVNGVSTGVIGLDDHTTPLGAGLDLGSVTAGDTLTFIDYVYTTSDTWYSNALLNSDGGNHVYATDVVANQAYGGSPAGTYVAFEDQPFGGSDYNYFDDTFVFTDTTGTIVSSVPEPAAWSILLLGFAGVGGLMRRQRLRIIAA